MFLKFKLENMFSNRFLYFVHICYNIQFKIYKVAKERKVLKVLKVLSYQQKAGPFD